MVIRKGRRVSLAECESLSKNKKTHPSPPGAREQPPRKNPVAETEHRLEFYNCWYRHTDEFISRHVR